MEIVFHDRRHDRDHDDGVHQDMGTDGDHLLQEVLGVQLGDHLDHREGAISTQDVRALAVQVVLGAVVDQRVVVVDHDACRVRGVHLCLDAVRHVHRHDHDRASEGEGEGDGDDNRMEDLGRVHP